jgi:hypothetical protein
MHSGCCDRPAIRSAEWAARIVIMQLATFGTLVQGWEQERDQQFEGDDRMVGAKPSRSEHV